MSVDSFRPTYFDGSGIEDMRQKIRKGNIKYSIKILSLKYKPDKQR